MPYAIYLEFSAIDGGLSQYIYTPNILVSGGAISPRYSLRRQRPGWPTARWSSVHCVDGLGKISASSTSGLLNHRLGPILGTLKDSLSDPDLLLRGTLQVALSDKIIHDLDMSPGNVSVSLYSAVLDRRAELGWPSLSGKMEY